MKIRKYLIPVLSVLALASCDYEKINTNIYGITEEEMKQGGLLYGAPFMDMQKLVIPIGSPTESTGPGNDLANTDVMSAGNYIGYWGMNNNWNFNTEATWNFTDARMNYAYQNFYSKLFRAWNDIYKYTKDSQDPADKEVQAVANVVKVMGWLRATDVFGPIVYTNAGNGDIAPKLDSQETVYKAMLAELKEASQVLAGTTTKVLSSYDVIYDGNAQNWTRLANSLILRLAVRVHFKDQELAKDYVSFALNQANGGVIETVAQEAKIQNTAKLPLMNSLIPIVEDYGECRLGTTIWAYMQGYSDPRLTANFAAGSYGFESLPPTNDKALSAFAKAGAAKPKVDASSPLFWLRASEVSFLKAEAALYKLTTGDPKTWYEEGVAKSFEENGVSGVDNYLQSDDVKPKDIERNTLMYNKTYSCKLSTNNVSPKWDDSDSDEVKLQKIITQKYLALYPNAVEAWTEYRRTGYPYLLKPAYDKAYVSIGAEADAVTPERFRFAPTEYGTNPNMSEVPTLLGGADQGATKLWWVRDGRPKQPK